MQRALAGLKNDGWDLLLWYYRDGLDALEIGNRLRITPGAVHVPTATVPWRAWRNDLA